jgi:hypothetical protein
MVNNIGKIDFLDTVVHIYYDQYSSSKDNFQIIFRHRNPDSFYQGSMFLNHSTGKLEYPKDAIIPEQTEKDKEIIPKAVILGKKILSKKELDRIKLELKYQYLKRNNKDEKN